MKVAMVDLRHVNAGVRVLLGCDLPGIFGTIITGVVIAIPPCICAIVGNAVHGLGTELELGALYDRPRESELGWEGNCGWDDDRAVRPLSEADAV
jgi:hypothetical protein